MRPAAISPTISLERLGVASDEDVTVLGDALRQIRLVLPTEDHAESCACKVAGDGGEPLTIVGVGPGDPVLSLLDDELLSGRVVVDPRHAFWVGSRMMAPGMSARVMTSLPFANQILLTTLTDFSGIAATSPASAARVLTHALISTPVGDERRAELAEAGWQVTEDPLELKGAA